MPSVAKLFGGLLAEGAQPLGSWMCLIDWASAEKSAEMFFSPTLQKATQEELYLLQQVEDSLTFSGQELTAQ